MFKFIGSNTCQALPHALSAFNLRVATASSAQGQVNGARHVIGCRLTQETTVRSAVGDVAD
jgi:hypothetical protein